MAARCDSPDFSDFEEVDVSEIPHTPLLSSSHELSLSSSTGDGHPPWQGHRDKLIRILVCDCSNGIRFSITDLSDPLARILNPVIVYRSSISLYDAQFDPETGDQIPIPETTITAVCEVLQRFMVVCKDFDVPEEHIYLVATEATRLAKNSAQLLQSIKEATGKNVELIEKEMEGEIGALGIASGFLTMEGLVMDLGGGSTQITWIISRQGHIRTSSNGSFSFPYGAAALTKRLEDIRKGKDEKDADHAVEQLRKEMVSNFKDAYQRLQVPQAMVEEAQREGGFRIYLSGGGFRGWGYLLLYLNQSQGQHYPISIINGYTVGREQFEDTKSIEKAAKAARDIFRISDRRRSQVPAVAFLVNVLAEAIPLGVREAHFCQGGVREGYLFRQLAARIRREAPLEVITRNFAPGSRLQIQELIRGAIPKPSKDATRRFPPDFGGHVMEAFTNVMYVHMFMSKETASTAALYSTSSGILASTLGVSHQDRARLALMLQARYRGELPPREVEFRDALRSIISPEDVWWAQYLGRVGFVITCLYPTGKVDPANLKVLFSSSWSSTLGKKGTKEGLVLKISIRKVKHDPEKLKKLVTDNLKVIEKAGKKKNWPGKDQSWGMKVEVRVAEEQIL
ncbi:hypothetical protein H634G_08443 [Metarhizium anisopliae BRIP 53293]|uniref:Uncharacterized protein n=1 Tax=Metarhizium anisopliae BRIP 53293 TaxID=1291518 RepID=A0A0D9NQL4_METAN|nr:hypothetical protein H634G_08443 [Metarhizium anisopliae BRIP 53293]KJK90031.1 hypothetical protein H633G_06092 [Metarhizium anisopliae BRIP 53284]